MRIGLRLLPSLLAIAILLAPFVPAEAQSCTLKISVVQDVFKVGSQVRVKVELKNTSQGNIALTGIPSGKEDHLDIEGFLPIVRDAKGKEPPLTKWGRMVFGRPIPADNSVLSLNSVISYPLEPGKVHTTEVIVSDLYDLSTPGTYTIQIPYEEATWSGHGMPLVCCERYLHEPKKEENKQDSNVVTVTVVP